ncbi:hypothetical protein OIU83_08155 [Flavobacterium sp. LS1R49]|uniref:Uncharacterized protein n=1 Tax=Flavobacterium shii TaxID=2987687 RepID=A0A9X2YUX2_9FLAO|nr:hypothetical protein [Flavobacterium shii]MCV9927619.1 hypothetical protein [Flavobacterium shii]
MEEIPKIEDKIKALYLYIDGNASDTEGDSWYYGHNPIIVSHINTLSKAECERLVSEIWNWKEEILVDLADPFLQIENPNLDGCFLYCKIFMNITDIENEQYLIENIHLVNTIPKRSQPISFFLDLENKIIRVNEKLDGRYKYCVEQIKLKINTEYS